MRQQSHRKWGQIQLPDAKQMIYCLMFEVAIGPLPAVTQALQRFGPKEEVPPWSKEITMLVIKCLLVEGNGYENGQRKGTIRRDEKMDVL